MYTPSVAITIFYKIKQSTHDKTFNSSSKNCSMASIDGKFILYFDTKS